MLALMLTAVLAAAPAGTDRDSRLLDIVAASYDTSRGGFVSKDGVPNDAAVELALAIAAENGDATWNERAVRTLEWELGLFDTLSGGFATGTRDADARLGNSGERQAIPNSRRLEQLLDVEALTGDASWRPYAERTVDFFDRVLLDGRGGFVRAQLGDRELDGEANGWAIRAWLRWAALEGDLRRREFAWKSLDRLWETCWSGPAGLVRFGVFGEIKQPPRLEDQTSAGRAYLLAAHLAGRESDLARARAIADTVLRVYPDPEGGFRTQAVPDKKGGIKKAARKLEENARATRFLAELAAVSGDARYREAARRTAATFAGELEKADATEAAEWWLARRAIERPALPPRAEWKAAEAKPERTPSLRYPAKKPRGRR